MAWWRFLKGLRGVAKHGMLCPGVCQTPHTHNCTQLQTNGHDKTITTQPKRQFIACLSAELARVEADAASFVSRFGQSGYDAVKSGWGDKLRRARAGEQRWALFVATKPAAA